VGGGRGLTRALYPCLADLLVRATLRDHSIMCMRLKTRPVVAYGVRCEVGVGSSYAISLHEPGLPVPYCVLCVLASDMLGRGGI